MALWKRTNAWKSNGFFSRRSKLIDNININKSCFQLVSIFAFVGFCFNTFLFARIFAVEQRDGPLVERLAGHTVAEHTQTYGGAVDIA